MLYVNIFISPFLYYIFFLFTCQYLLKSKTTNYNMFANYFLIIIFYISFEISRFNFFDLIYRFKIILIWIYKNAFLLNHKICAFSSFFRRKFWHNFAFELKLYCSNFLFTKIMTIPTYDKVVKFFISIQIYYMSHYMLGHILFEFQNLKL